MKFLVTGASGQLGAALVRRLVEDGHEVIAYLRHRSSDARLKGLPVTIARSALLDRFGLKKWMKGCDGVFHVAGLISWARRDRERLFLANLEGTRSVVQVAKESKIPRVVVTSSVFALGLPNHSQPIDETFSSNVLKTGVDYAIAKHQGQEAALALAEPGFDVVVVNPGVIMHEASRTAARIKSGHLDIAFPGAISFVAQDDVVEGHMLAFARGRSKEAYILGGECLSYREAYATMARHFGVSAPAKPVSPFLLKIMAFLGEASHALLRKGPPLMTYALAKVMCSTNLYASRKAERELGWTYKPLAATLETYFPQSSNSP